MKANKFREGVNMSRYINLIFIVIIAVMSAFLFMKNQKNENEKNVDNGGIAHSRDEGLDCNETRPVIMPKIILNRDSPLSNTEDKEDVMDLEDAMVVQERRNLLFKEELEQLFENDAAGDERSIEIEQAWETVFSSSDIEGAVLNKMECRANRCRAQVWFKDRISDNRTLFYMLDNYDFGMKATIPVRKHNGDGSIETTVYLYPPAN